MKITSYAVARPQYYDRGAVSTFFSYAATLSQHAATTRWTTTVAAGKKLLLEQGEAFLLTTVAAAIPLRVAAKATISDGTNQTTWVARDQVQSASLLNPDIQNVYPGITVYAGEIVFAQTFIDSATGSIFMSIGMKGTTFQA